MRTFSFCMLLLVLAPWPRAVAHPAAQDIWKAREVVMSDSSLARIRIGVWDSGVDTSLFAPRLARDAGRRAVIRGYDSFKRREDAPMAMLPLSMLERRDALNATLQALDDIDSNVESPAATALAAKLRAHSRAEAVLFNDDMGRWSGFVHGTAIADIVLRNNASAEIVIARMEWWHGSPPLPCWTRELAHREADSIRDLLSFLVASGVRVVNMSWGRAERAYRQNLTQCAPGVPEVERNALARYTVDTIRAVLKAGMASAPAVLFVGAAGNAGNSVEAENPATRFSLPNFILVGAVTRSGARATYTNTGPEVTLYANGEREEARLPGGAVSYPSGTSMAAPNVANAAAKVLAINPELSGARLRALLEASADTNATGEKLLHPARAVAAARGGRSR
jgi:hypothetical protein